MFIILCMTPRSPTQTISSFLLGKAPYNSLLSSCLILMGWEVETTHGLVVFCVERFKSVPLKIEDDFFYAF